MNRILAILFVAFPAWSASWYIDNAATGSRTGASWTDAWTNLEAIAWAGISPGDTIYISGGSTTKTYMTNRMVIPALASNGTLASPITIGIGQDAGHNGVAIFDYSAWGTNSTTQPFNFGGKNFYRFNGEYNGNTNFLICNSIGFSDGGELRTIEAGYCNGLELSHVILSNVEMGVAMNEATNWTIRNCYFKVWGDAAVRCVETVVLTNFDCQYVSSNTIIMCHNPDYDAASDGVQTMDGLTIRGNNFWLVIETNHAGNQHNDHIQSVSDYVKIYDNMFTDMQDAHVTIAHINEPAGISNVYVYNNIFRIGSNTVDPQPQFLRMYNNWGLDFYQNVRIFNNLFMDNSSNTYYVGIAEQTNHGAGYIVGTNNIFANNMFINCGAAGFDETFRFSTNVYSEWTITNNLFYHTNASYPKITWGGATNEDVQKTPIEWANENDPTTRTNLPSFIRYVAYSMDNDMRLSATDTEARTHGFVYNSDFTTDRLGRTRGVVWDLGPYEFDSTNLMVHLTFEDAFDQTNYIQDWSDYGNHAWKFSNWAGFETNWPRRTNSASTAGSNSVGNCGDFLWYQSGYGAYGESGDYAGITNTGSLSNLTQATICLWSRYHAATRVNPTNQRNNELTSLFLSSGDTHGDGIIGGWTFGRYGSPFSRFSVVTNAGPYRYYFNFDDTTGSSSDSSNWTHYAAVFSNGNVWVYQDSVLLSNASIAAPSLVSASFSYTTPWIGIGCDTHMGSPPLESNELFGPYPNSGWKNGVMDDIRIYSVALSSNDIYNIYSGQSVGAESGDGEPATTNTVQKASLRGSKIVPRGKVIFR